MAHGGGRRVRQRALALQVGGWTAGGGRSYQGENVPEDYINEGAAREEDHTKMEVSTLPPPQSRPQCSADIPKDSESYFGF